MKDEEGGVPISNIRETILVKAALTQYCYCSQKVKLSSSRYVELMA